MSISNKSRGGLLVALMAAALLACFVAPVRAWAAELTVGDDGQYASLNEAYEKASSGDTLKLTSDLEASQLLLIDVKSIVIDGDGHAITRADSFATKNDGRGAYNPAMIEVANGATLTLQNITLDDAMKTIENPVFTEQPTGSGDKKNETRVQDAIIAAYAAAEGGHGSTIVLGSNVILKNFGGMSAVRVGGQGKDAAVSSKLVMQSGSKIIDDSATARAGGAAAIWSQGGIVAMQAGSEISSISGRAMYLEDGAYATVDGSIHDITANSVMTANPEKGSDLGAGAQNGGFGGIVAAVRGNSTFMLGNDGDAGSSGTITGIVSDGNFASDVAFWLNGSSLVTKQGTSIKGLTTIGLVDSDGGTIDIAGDVSNCSLKNVYFRLRGTTGTFILQETGRIVECTTTDVGILYLNGGKPTISIAGTIDTVNKPVLYISDNGSNKDGTITLTSTGVIKNVTGSAIRAQDPSRVTIQGTITDCSGYAVDYEPKSQESLLVIEDSATIQNNSRGGAQIKVSGSLAATDAQEHVVVEPGGLDGNATIDLNAYSVTLDADYDQIKLGNANSAAVTAIQEGVAERAGWTIAAPADEPDAVWLQPSESEVHFTVSRTDEMKRTVLYVALIQLNEGGAPEEGAAVTFTQVKNTDPVDMTLTGLTPGKSYAMMFVNSAEYTLAPDDITIYEGDTLPSLTIANSVDPITSLKVGGSDVTGENPMETLLGYLDVTYYDENGNVAVAPLAPGSYTVKLGWNDTKPDGDVTVNDNKVNINGEGSLIVRYVENEAGAEENATTYPLLTDAPGAAVEHAEAIAKESLIPSLLPTEFYTNDDASRKVDASGIQILDDDLLTYEGEDRTTPMQEKAAQYLGEPAEGKAYSYEFHYLDLVDANNGNAWVSASYGTTVYLPYPDGVTAENADELGVNVIHYKDLHREYGITGQDNVNEAIAACDMETMTADFTEYGIKFDVSCSGFSPFAIVWQTDAPDEPDVPTPPATSYEITATAGEGGTISPSGTVSVTAGGSKSFSITPDEGYLVQSVIVDGVNIGATDSYTFANVREDHTISVTFIRGNAPSDPDDTGVSDWFDTKSHDVFLHGYDNGLFGPENNMTRGEAAAMFYNMLLDKSEGDAEYTFEDVSEGRFYTKPIRVLATRGLLFGTSETTFEPERPITRAEFTAIAMRFSNSDRTGEGLENIFTDVHEDDWFYGVVVSSTQFGWIYGYNDGTGRFGPNDTITRAQATSIANRMLGRMADGVWIAAHLDELKLFPDVPEGHFAFRAIAEATNAHDYVKHGIYESWTGVR